MLQWLKRSDENAPPKYSYETVVEGLQHLYREKLAPIERDHWFNQIFSPQLTDADFAAQPMVLLLGQYSTGKSTFVRHLLQRDYPGLRIGPEPTTDKFMCILHGDSDQVIPGHALVVDKNLPFTQLSHFGTTFLSRLECSRLPSPVLEGISLIDSPGVLSGETQRIKRGYEFENVVKWFSDRADAVLLLFDVSKLDISDEFRRVISAIKSNNHKIHIILNKADIVSTQELMRVYGALMWSLGKVIDTPEISRVFVGSFWEEPLMNENLRELFEKEENDLYTKLAVLPRSSATRKVDDLIKRARLARVHAYLMDHIYASMPTFFGHSAEKDRILGNLHQICYQLSQTKNLPLGDFPNPDIMKQRLVNIDFTKLSYLDPRKMQALTELLDQDLPELLKLIPEEQARIGVEPAAIGQICGGPSPFAVMLVDGVSEKSANQSEWLSQLQVSDYRAEFEGFELENGKLSGAKAKEKMIESKLPSAVLHRIWTLSDRDEDGMLALGEYAIAMRLTEMKLRGLDLPVTLPENIISEIED